MLKHQTIVQCNQTLGWSAYWKSETSEFGTDAFEVGSPSVSDDLCIAPISFRYRNLNHYTGWTVSNLEYQLVVNALAYISDDGEPMVGTVTCVTNQDEVKAEKEALSDLKEDGYLNYLRVLTPGKRRDAISDLADLTWGIDNPKKMKLNHKKRNNYHRKYRISRSIGMRSQTSTATASQAMRSTSIAQAVSLEGRFTSGTTTSRE